MTKQCPEKMMALESTTVGSMMPDPKWLHGIWDVCSCSYCSRILSSWYGKPLNLQLLDIDYEISVDNIHRTGCGIVSKKLFDVVKPYIGNDIIVGNCYSQNKLSNEFLRWYSTDPVYERAEIGSRIMVCKVCDLHSTTLPQGKEYILSQQVHGRDVLLTDLSFPIVSQRIAREIAKACFDDIKFNPVYIRDTPIDGHHFPGDPPIE